jgi:hypothetical protein
VGWWEVKEEKNKKLGFPIIKRWLVGAYCVAYCVNMMTSNRFILVMWPYMRQKSYRTFWIFSIFVIFCYMPTIALASLSIFFIFWHHFTFHLYHILVCQYFDDVRKLALADLGKWLVCRRHSEPKPTSTPSTGFHSLVSCGWTSTELRFGFTLVTNSLNRSHTICRKIGNYEVSRWFIHR